MSVRRGPRGWVRARLRGVRSYGRDCPARTARLGEGSTSRSTLRFLVSRSFAVAQSALDSGPRWLLRCAAVAASRRRHSAPAEPSPIRGSSPDSHRFFAHGRPAERLLRHGVLAGQSPLLCARPPRRASTPPRVLAGQSPPFRARPLQLSTNGTRLSASAFG